MHACSLYYIMKSMKQACQLTVNLATGREKSKSQVSPLHLVLLGAEVRGHLCGSSVCAHLVPTSGTTARSQDHQTRVHATIASRKLRHITITANIIINYDEIFQSKPSPVKSPQLLCFFYYDVKKRCVKFVYLRSSDVVWGRHVPPAVIRGYAYAITAACMLVVKTLTTHAPREVARNCRHDNFIIIYVHIIIIYCDLLMTHFKYYI